ncbi:MAG: tetratricopeptide repeat protein [Anaerolineae bacterium]
MPRPNHLSLIVVLCLVCVLIIGCKASEPTPTATADGSPTDSAGGLDPIATLTFIEGDVTLDLTGGTSGRAPGLAILQSSAPARPFRALQSGASVRLAANSRATVVCFNNRALPLLGPLVVRITGQRCQSGTPLPSKAAGRVRPAAGRIRSAGGSLAVEGEAREKEEDYGSFAIILNPRNTALQELAPVLQWVEVPGAIEYQVKLNNPTASFELVLDSAQLTCVEDGHTTPHRVCSAPWPTSKGALVPGQTYFLTVGARKSFAEAWRLTPQPSQLQPLTAEQADQVQAEETTIKKLGLDDVTVNLLLAGLYTEHKLYGQAIAAYERALVLQPVAVLYVTLGDIYRQTDLHRFALDAYEQALKLLVHSEDDPAVHAAAEFGLGQVYYAYAGNYAEAKSHYAEAVRLYEHLDAAEELKAAQEGLKMATERAP